MREQVRKLERDLAHVAFIWSKKQQEIDTAAEWVRSKDEELIRATRHLEDTSDQLSQVEEELVSLRQTSSAVQEDLGEQLDEQKEEVAGLKLKLLNMQDELDAEREEWAAKIEAAREDTEKRAEQAKAENQRSQRAYDALKGLAQSEKETHTLQQQNLRLQLAELGERLTQTEIAEIDAQRKNVEMVARLSEKNAELEANSKTVSLLQTQLQALEETHQDAAALAKKNEESLASRLSKTEAELNQLSDSSGVTREELERMETALPRRHRPRMLPKRSRRSFKIRSIN